jgi:hypothetical protein
MRHLRSFGRGCLWGFASALFFIGIGGLAHMIYLALWLGWHLVESGA